MDEKGVEGPAEYQIAEKQKNEFETILRCPMMHAIYSWAGGLVESIGANLAGRSTLLMCGLEWAKRWDGVNSVGKWRVYAST